MASGAELGGIVDDATKGGRGERWTALHALLDWFGNEEAESGQGRRHRACLLPVLHVTKGLSVDHNNFLPWFRVVNASIGEKMPGRQAEIHLDNARVHLFSADFNPKDRKHLKAALLDRALLYFPEEAGPELDEEREDVKTMTRRELVELIISMEGQRRPETFKIAEEFGNKVERTPPYHPEFQPIELVWQYAKNRYNQRYLDLPMKDFLPQSFAGIPEETLVRYVERCDRNARRGAGDQPVLLINDDFPGDGPDGGERSDVGEMR